jgi:4-hydroxy-3-methylbut-2-enyl diphosphate reductase IspH
VVFSTHGVPPVVRTEGADWGLVVIDGRCLLVTEVHAGVRRLTPSPADVS